MARKQSHSQSRAPSRAQGRKRARVARKERREVPWSFVAAIALLAVALVVLVVIFLSWRDAKPFPTSYPSALNAFLAQGVSAIIAPDLATDFSGGNYTLAELKEKYPGFEADIAAVDRALRDAEHDVLATVNGDQITRAELESQAALLPKAYRDALTDAKLLEEMINERLILQDAAARNIAVSDTDVDAAWTALLEKGNLTEAELTENIASYGLTPADLRALLERQLKIAKVFNETFANGDEATLQEIRAFYDAHLAEFRTGAEVTVRHVLVAAKEGEEAAARAEAEAALSALAAGAEFCALVERQSDDLGSKQTCGEYTFGRGFMVKPFEDASFALAPGEREIVQTQFGFHVIEKIAETAGETIPFEQVAALIGQRLAAERQAESYQSYLASLKERAVIVMAAPSGSPTIEADVEAVDQTQLPIEEAVPDAIAETAGPVETQSDEGSAEASPIEELPSDELLDESPAPPSDASIPEDVPSFAACLAQRGATLYIASWDVASTQELEKFGAAAAKLRVVDCAAVGAPCDDVAAYPSWSFNGEMALGTLSFGELAGRTGCMLE